MIWPSAACQVIPIRSGASASAASSRIFGAPGRPATAALGSRESTRRAAAPPDRAGAGRRVSGRVAYSRIAVISAQATNDPTRRTAAITPARSSSDNVARIFSSVVAAWTRVARTGPGISRRAEPPSPNPACEMSSAVSSSPAAAAAISSPRYAALSSSSSPGGGNPGTSGASGGSGGSGGSGAPSFLPAGAGRDPVPSDPEPEGSGSSGSGAESGAGGMNHLSFGRKKEGSLGTRIPSIECLFESFADLFSKRWLGARGGRSPRGFRGHPAQAGPLGFTRQDRNDDRGAPRPGGPGHGLACTCRLLAAGRLGEMFVAEDG